MKKDEHIKGIASICMMAVADYDLFVSQFASIPDRLKSESSIYRPMHDRKEGKKEMAEAILEKLKAYNTEFPRSEVFEQDSTGW